MIRRAMCCITFALLLGIFLPLGAQAQGMATEGFVDDFIVHVKQNCRPQYDNLVKKLVAANHANGGDNWIAMESTYGEGNIVRFVSTRENYAGIESAQGKFMMALQKGMGEVGMTKLFSELGACSESTQGVLRARRWDLSTGVPADPAAQAKVIGNARWIRIFTVHVRPGMAGRFEAMVKTVNAAMAKADPNASSWISQSAAGDNGIVYYISQLRPSLASFDGGKSMREMMGDEAFAAFQKDSSEVVTRTDVAIYQMSGSLSNAPDEVAAVAPNFWRPHPMMAAPTPKKPATTNPPAKKN
jgi:hypothetical protein